ncbi:UNVERIFIED_CONTAM: hypothetical protein Sradi_1904400 [Sesamum radiatum]|uniref:Uncharacterized protein n=1 Tax=Sesamum radiatum TaxID=300843 RepID=A0AAW2TXM3_SESRA
MLAIKDIHPITRFSKTEQPSCSVGRRSAGRRSQVTLRARCLLDQRPAEVANHLVARARCEQQPAATKQSKRPREPTEARPATSASVSQATLTTSDLDLHKPSDQQPRQASKITKSVSPASH